MLNYTTQSYLRAFGGCRRVSMIVLLAGLLPGVAYAQAVVAAQPKENGKKVEEETVVLSPFLLEESNKGYYATNTMSGTRMNTSLEDLGASISVVTKQQMDDFALLDINDIFLYEANTEGIGNYTDFTVDRNGNVIDNAQGNPNNANRVRGIAAANIAFGNFETSGRVPIDPINIQAVEISRGPNANIFGLGRASGTVNMVPSRADTRRTSNQLSLRVDDLGGNRVSLDINRPLVRGQLGFKLGLVRQEDHFHRKPSVNRTKRIIPMLTWQPTKKTTFRVSMEDYENFSRRANYMTPRDTIGYWIANGKPSWDPVTWTAKVNGQTYGVVAYNSNTTTENNALPPGIETGGAGLYARPSMFVDNGKVQYWTVNRRTGVNTTTGLPTPDFATGNIRFMESSTDLMKSRPALFSATTGLSDRSIYDWESINLVATNYSEDKVRTYRVELDQQIFSTHLHSMHFNAGWFREDANKYSRNFLGQESALILYVDVNERYLDGTPNPYFGRPYVGASEPSTYRTPLLRDTYRAQLAYDLNLTNKDGWMKHLGRHTVLGYGEYKRALGATLRYRDCILSNHSWITPGAARANSVTAGRAYYRYYVGDANGHNVDYSTPHIYNLWGKYDLNWYNGTDWVKENAEVGEAAYLATPAPNINIIKTKGMLTQHHLLHGKVVGTFGLREDRSYSRTNDANGVPLLEDGIRYDMTKLWGFGANSWLARIGKTKNYGVVAKPFSWLNFHYNRSDSFLPSTPAQSLMLEILPDPSGEGKDYGFSFNLFNQKLILRFNMYKNSQLNTRAGDSGIIATRAGRLDFQAFGNDQFNLERNIRGWMSGSTEDQIRAEIFRVAQISAENYDALKRYSTAETSDIVSRGKEIEINYNPNRVWRTRVTIGQQRTFDSNLSPNIQKYIDARMPVWESIIDPRYNLPWFTYRYGSAGTAKDFLTNSVLAPYKLARANEGKSKSQVREWRVNMITNYSLAGITDNRWLKAVNLGGAVRWEDKASIGYYWNENDHNEFDPNRQIWDKSRAYFDLTISYNQRLFKNTVSARYQLNVRNVFENGRLQAVAALPDGTPYAFRIIDPRQIILSATFDF